MPIACASTTHGDLDANESLKALIMFDQQTRDLLKRQKKSPPRKFRLFTAFLESDTSKTPFDKSNNPSLPGNFPGAVSALGAAHQRRHLQCVTRDQDPLSLRSPPPVHTRFYILPVHSISTRLTSNFMPKLDVENNFKIHTPCHFLLGFAVAS